jgi:nucleotide-binding universal stress UspA family protein
MATALRTHPAAVKPIHALIADDGSPSAACARQLMLSLSWPPGTSARSVAAVDDSSGHFGGGPLPRILAGLLDAGAEDLRAAGLQVQTSVLRGFPGAAIVAAAGHLEADLVIVGSHSREGYAASGLGPVACFVAERARSHVLIARRSSARSILIAYDASQACRDAIRIAATWPLFEHRPIHLVSVVELPEQLRHLPFTRELIALMPGTAEAVQEQRAALQTGLAEARKVLEDAGRTVTSETRVGRTTQELLTAADVLDAELLVIGTRRPHPPVGALGPVGRDVLAHSSASVLLVRPGLA